MQNGEPPGGICGADPWVALRTQREIVEAGGHPEVCSQGRSGAFNNSLCFKKKQTEKQKEEEMQVSGPQVIERGRHSKHKSRKEAGDRNTRKCDYTSIVTLSTSVVRTNRQHASRETV